MRSADGGNQALDLDPNLGELLVALLEGILDVTDFIGEFAQRMYRLSIARPETV